MIPRALSSALAGERAFLEDDYMTVTTDLVAEMYKEVCEMREMLAEERARAAFRNTEIAELKGVVFAEAGRSAFRNTEIAALKNTVLDLGESMRLKDRKTLSVAEAARRADVKPATVRKWLESGELKGTKTGARKQSRWRIAVRDLNRFLERNNNTSEQAAQSVSVAAPSGVAS